MMKDYRVADFIADYLVDIGITNVFLLPGGGAMYLVDAFGRQQQIGIIACHHEQAVGIAAEACGRIQGNFGVGIVTSGPGATNIITPVVGAWIESIPMLIISGQAKRADLVRNSGVRQKGVQEVDIVSLVKNITKYAITLEKPTDIKLELQKAIFLANSGRKGPVWLDIPLDVQSATINPDLLEAFQKPAEEELIGYSFNLGEIIKLIKEAKRPLILVGHGVRLDNAVDGFRNLVRILEIPVVSTWNAMDFLPYNDPLYVGRPGVVALRAPNFAVQNCDLLISIGCRIDNIITAFNPKNFALKAKKIVVDVDPKELDKHEMNIDVKLNMGARVFIDLLLKEKDQFGPLSINQWREKCLDWKNRYPVNDGKPFKEELPLSHYEFCDMLSEFIPENTIISTGSSGLAIEIFYTVFRNKPGQRVFLTSGLGAMGYGLPAAVGACVANNKEPIVAIESDGSLQLNIQEFATIQANRLPVCLIVLNNAGYNSIRNTQRNYFDGRLVATGLESGLWFPSLEKIAETYDLDYFSITKKDDIKNIIPQALSLKKACIVDVTLNTEEILAPKVAAMAQKDGSMISMPLEDMNPLLPIETLKKEMLTGLSPESIRIRS